MSHANRSPASRSLRGPPNEIESEERRPVGDRSRPSFRLSQDLKVVIFQRLERTAMAAIQQAGGNWRSAAFLGPEKISRSARVQWRVAVRLWLTIAHHRLEQVTDLG